jgi:hypothetical protein
MASGSVTLTPKSLIEYRMKTGNKTTSRKTTNNKPPHLDDEITKKKSM